MDKYLELGKKLKALSEQGEGGEKYNAEKALDALMKKNNITKEQLENVVRKWKTFKINKHQKQLFSQVSYSILGKDNDVRVHPRRNEVYEKCTEAEFIEISSKFDFYWRAYEKKLKIFYLAFVDKNDIYPKDIRISSSELTEEEKLERKQAALMGMAMSSDDYSKQLEAGKA